MARNPTKIKGINNIQMFAYYKSFLTNLDVDMNAGVTDWEADFIGSCVDRVEPYTENQAEIIRRLMDKFPRVNPTYKHYDTEEHAREFIYV